MDNDREEEMTPARALIVYLNLAAMSRRPIEQAEIRPMAIRAIEHINQLTAEVRRLTVAIAKQPETYPYIEEDGTWHGQEFCRFCDGEMANQQVNHKPGCIWQQSQSALQETE